MNERERLLLYEMLRIARGKLLETGPLNTKALFPGMHQLAVEAACILSTLGEIYGTPIKDVETKT